jgi:hypothetical protein
VGLVLGGGFRRSNTILAGLGVGSFIAKSLGALDGCRAFGFWGYGLSGEALKDYVFVDPLGATYVTTVYNMGGFWAKPEWGFGESYGMPWVAGSGEMFWERDSRYRSFCSLVAFCQAQSRFVEFCEQAAAEDFDMIREAFAALREGQWPA